MHFQEQQDLHRRLTNDTQTVFKLFPDVMRFAEGHHFPFRKMKTDMGSSLCDFFLLFIQA